MNLKTKKMNLTHKNNLYLLALLAALASCTKDFETYNTNPTQISNDALKGDYQYIVSPLLVLQRSISNFSGGGDPNSFQVQQNLGADDFSGYFMSPNPFGGRSNLNYALNPSWNEEPFKVGYINVMANVMRMKEANVDQDYPAIWAIVLTLKVMNMQRVTDVYGPIPYSRSGQLTDNPYDSQQQVYTTFFSELDTAQQLLQTYIASGETLPLNMESVDLVYKGDLNNWLALLNSLRLRLAIRIAMIDPEKAKTEGEKALDPVNGGVITANAQNMNIRVEGAGFTNPLYAVANNWADTRVGASIQSYLVGYDDPRLPKYMDRSTDATFSARYIGIRIGANIVNKPDYQTYSNINVSGSNPSFTATSPIRLISAAEVSFLKAEAALRGWAGAGASVKSLYESGVTFSFEQWGVSGAAAYLQSGKLPAAYDDPKDAKSHGAASLLSQVPAKWDDTGSKDKQLEQIMTQKWIALFPDGPEAWAEYRRTGYPKLFPVVNNFSGNTIDTQIQIRRLPFPQNEQNSNAAELAKAVALLGGGPDNGGTRLWWDVPNKRF